MENEEKGFGLRHIGANKTLQKIAERENELHEFRQRILEQEKELDEYRTQLKREQLTREKQLQHELEAREKLYAEKEKKQFERQREIEEQLHARQEEFQQIRARLEAEITQRQVQLEMMMQSLEQEKARYNEESRKKIEKKSSDYVIDALDTLKKKEEQFHFWSRFWGFSGAISLAIGVVFFIGITIYSFINLPANINWEFITFSLFKGLIAVTLFAAIAKYSYLLSNSYMREALKNGDRRHAINFGKFYLESYGAAAEWSQIKEAFEHWNITGNSSFGVEQNSQADVTALEKVANAVIVKLGQATEDKIKAL